MIKAKILQEKMGEAIDLIEEMFNDKSLPEDMGVIIIAVELDKDFPETIIATTMDRGNTIRVLEASAKSINDEDFSGNA